MRSKYHLPNDPSKEVFTAENCHILELLNNQEDKPFSVARARVEPGITTAWHQLRDTEEYYYIISGKGVMEIGDQKEFFVVAGDLVTIPANTRQRITNAELDSDLYFLAICTPAFRDEIYEELE